MTTEQARPDPVSADSETGPPDRARGRPTRSTLTDSNGTTSPSGSRPMMLIREFEIAPATRSPWRAR